MMTIENLVTQLANKHNFNLTLPGRALWVENPEPQKQPHSDLVICVCPRKSRYIVGRTYPYSRGFCVYYSDTWQPLRAFNDSGRPIRDLEQANDEMCEVVEYFESSAEVLITEIEGDG